jgi:hypothetical protein
MPVWCTRPSASSRSKPSNGGLNSDGAQSDELPGRAVLEGGGGRVAPCHPECAGAVALQAQHGSVELREQPARGILSGIGCDGRDRCGLERGAGGSGIRRDRPAIRGAALVEATADSARRAELVEFHGDVVANHGQPAAVARA